MDTNRLIYEADTDYAHYQVWDTVYGGRPARVLYSGQRSTAQSGLARDDRPELLFDYSQRMLELAGALQPSRLLLIGGGAYTLPQALLAALPRAYVDVVEIDGGLESIARRFFGLRPDARLRLIRGDGGQYLERNSQPYDLILVDAFVNADIPKTLQSLSAVKEYKRNLTAHGVYAQNIIAAYHGTSAEPLQVLLKDYDMVFPDVRVFPAGLGLPLTMSQNLLLVAQPSKQWPLDRCMRHAALPRRPAASGKHRRRR